MCYDVNVVILNMIEMIDMSWAILHYFSDYFVGLEYDGAPIFQSSSLWNPQFYIVHFIIFFVLYPLNCVA